MERVIRLETRGLERADNSYFLKIREGRNLLDGMEKAFRDLDITSCDERTLKSLRCHDTLGHGYFWSRESGTEKDIRRWTGKDYLRTTVFLWAQRSI